MSPDTKPTKPIDLYLRVSDVAGREGDSFISPQVQEERCRAFLVAAGYVAGEVFTDLDKTGRNQDRPGFQEVLDRALTGVSGGIVVWKLSRFGRNTKEVLDSVEALEEKGAVLLSTSETLDTSNPMGRFVLTIFAALAELESEQIREGWETANEKALAKGIHVSGRVPAGYERDENRVLVPTVHAAAIREAFELRADGSTYEQVARHLTDAGVPKSRETDGPTWTSYAVAALLQNRVYLGEARAGGNVKADAHEALVDAGLFARVQARREEKGSFADPDRHRELLAGIVRCAGCGHSMIVDKRVKDGRVVQRYWRCSSRCEERAAISVEKLELHVWKFIAANAEALSVPLPRSNDEAIRAAQIRLDNATAALDEHVGSTPAKLGLSQAVWATMAATLEADRDEAAALLNDVVEGEQRNGDWSSVEIDDSDIRLIVKVDVSSGSVEGQDIVWSILNANQQDNGRARRMVRQVVQRVVVTKGRAPLDERVSIDLV